MNKLNITRIKEKGYLILQGNEEGCFCQCGAQIAFEKRKRPKESITIICPKCGRIIIYG